MILHQVSHLTYVAISQGGPLFEEAFDFELFRHQESDAVGMRRWGIEQGDELSRLMENWVTLVVATFLSILILAVSLLLRDPACVERETRRMVADRPRALRWRIWNIDNSISYMGSLVADLVGSFPHFPVLSCVQFRSGSGSVLICHICKSQLGAWASKKQQIPTV